MSKTHTCPCGSHQHPGELVGEFGPHIVVMVVGPDRTWLEVRTPRHAEGLCEEPLLAALVVPTVMP